MVISVLEGKVENGNIIDTAVPVLVGSNVTIACDMVEAYTSQLVVSWANIPRDNPRFNTIEDSITRELLIIENIQRQDADDYICFAANNISAVSKPITIEVGSLPDPYIITVESKDNSLSISWILNSTTNNPAPVINLFVAYMQVNGTSPETKMQKLAPPVSKTKIRNLPAGFLYKVQVWSSNAFGNSTPSEEVCIVIAGMLKRNIFLGVNILTGPGEANGDNGSSGAVTGTVYCNNFLSFHVIVLIVSSMLI